MLGCENLLRGFSRDKTLLSGTSINIFLILNHFRDDVVLPLLRERTDRGIVGSQGSSMKEASHSSPREAGEVGLPRGDGVGVGRCDGDVGVCSD